MAGFFSFLFGNSANNAVLEEKQKLQKILEGILRTSVAKNLGMM